MEYSRLLKLRKILIEELKKLEDDKVVLLPYPSYFLKILLFDEEEYSYDLCPFYHKIDFSNVDFSDIRVRGKDFAGMTGVKINPQTVYDKDLSHGVYEGVEFIGPFDNVNVEGARFKGSKNAIIDPQKTYMKNMDWTDCCDVTIIGSFENVSCSNIKLEGSIRYIYGNPELDFNTTYNKPKYVSSLEKDFAKKIKKLVKEENLKK
jgi:hypothetical protein